MKRLTWIAILIAVAALAGCTEQQEQKPQVVPVSATCLDSFTDVLSLAVVKNLTNSIDVSTVSPMRGQKLRSSEAPVVVWVFV